MKKIQIILFLFTLACTFTNCVNGETGLDTLAVSSIALEGNSIIVEGNGATVDGSTVTITSAGTYTIRGTLNDGQIIVDAADQDKVTLILSGAHISCSTSAPICVISADKTIITLADGTSNSITDGSSCVLPDVASDEPNAALFSKDDLTINGGGSLAVNGNYNDGITSNDDLKITGGRITVHAVNDGIRGRDSVVIKGGTIAITAAGDGIQSNNDGETDKGYVSIEDGSISIVAGADGIQAETTLAISGGTVTVTSGGGSGNGSNGNIRDNRGMGTVEVESDTGSAKGLKAGVALTVTGGTLNINSSDDAVHSNGCITIDGGIMSLASGDDAIHADTSLEINGGEISITNCYEGLDSETITINDGTIHLVARDDGVNAVSKTAVSVTARQPGQQAYESSGNSAMTINGGYLVVNSGGDGLDINGPITMTGGLVIINGPTDNGNGAIDYLGTFKVSGGTLLAVGSAGMAQPPGTSSSQCSVIMTYQASQPAGTLVHIETGDGEEIFTFKPAKAYQSVVFSSPALAKGTDYVVYSGGSVTGSATDGLSTSGIFTPGTQVASFTISGMVTTAGSSNTLLPGGIPANRNEITPGNMAENRTGTFRGNESGVTSGRMNGMMPGNRGRSLPGMMPGTASGGTGYSAPPGNSGGMGYTNTNPDTIPGRVSTSFSSTASGGSAYTKPAGIRL